MADAAPAVTATGAYLAVAKGANADPREITRRAIAALGGIERFVKKGNDVIIKPNVCTAYYPFEYAATTNPEVVAAIVQLCLEAGAKRVRVMDFPFGGTAQASYDKSGIGAAVKAAGGAMETMSNMKYRDVQIPQGKRLKQWKVYGDIQDADVVINVPIAKDHSGATLTLGMKNLMGVVLDRNGMHSRAAPVDRGHQHGRSPAIDGRGCHPHLDEQWPHRRQSERRQEARHRSSPAPTLWPPTPSPPPCST